MTTLDNIINECNFKTLNYKLKNFVQCNIPGPYGKKINLLDTILDHKIGDYLKLNDDLLRTYYFEVSKLFHSNMITADTYKELLDVNELSFRRFYSLLECKIQVSGGKIFKDEIRIKYPKKYESICNLINQVLVSSIEFYSEEIGNDYLKYGVRSSISAATFSLLFNNLDSTLRSYGTPENYIYLLNLMMFSILAPSYFTFLGDLIDSICDSIRDKSIKLSFCKADGYLETTKKLAPFYFIYDSTISVVLHLGINILSNVSKLPEVVESVISRYLNYFIFFSTVNKLYSTYELMKEKINTKISSILKKIKETF